jgi:hypothetical protein
MQKEAVFALMFLVSFSFRGVDACASELVRIGFTWLLPGRTSFGGASAGTCVALAIHSIRRAYCNYAYPEGYRHAFAKFVG